MQRTGLVAPWYVASSWTRDQTSVSCISRQILNHWTTMNSFSCNVCLNIDENQPPVVSIYSTCGDRLSVYTNENIATSFGFPSFEMMKYPCPFCVSSSFQSKPFCLLLLVFILQSVQISFTLALLSPFPSLATRQLPHISLKKRVLCGKDYNLPPPGGLENDG